MELCLTCLTSLPCTNILWAWFCTTNIVDCAIPSNFCLLLLDLFKFCKVSVGLDNSGGEMSVPFPGTFLGVFRGAFLDLGWVVHVVEGCLVRRPSEDFPV